MLRDLVYVPRGSRFAHPPYKQLWINPWYGRKIRIRALTPKLYYQQGKSPKN